MGVDTDGSTFYEVFIRGADRPWLVGDALIETLIFKKADELWTTVLKNLITFINNLH